MLKGSTDCSEDKAHINQKHKPATCYRAAQGTHQPQTSYMLHVGVVALSFRGAASIKFRVGVSIEFRVVVSVEFRVGASIKIRVVVCIEFRVGVSIEFR